MKGVVLRFKSRSGRLSLNSLKRPISSVKDFLSRYGTYTLFTALFFMGLAVGAACSRGVDSQLLGKLDFLFVTNMKARLSMSPFDIFLSCFASYFIFVFFIFLFAFSAWGFAAVPLLIIFKGFSVGLSSACLFSSYRMSGIGFYILVILPGTAMFLIALVRYSARALALSMRFAKMSVFGRDEAFLCTSVIKRFLKRSLFAFILSGACAVADMLLWVLFADKFHFY